MKGVAGNKGAVAIRLDLNDSSLCFVTAHFAAGSSNVEERCHDFHTISDGLRFQRGKLIASHDSVIWLGDFNFRVPLPREEVRDAIFGGDLDKLLAVDQLRVAMNGGLVFSGYEVRAQTLLDAADDCRKARSRSAQLTSTTTAAPSTTRARSSACPLGPIASSIAALTCVRYPSGLTDGAARSQSLLARRAQELGSPARHGRLPGARAHDRSGAQGGHLERAAVVLRWRHGGHPFSPVSARLARQTARPAYRHSDQRATAAERRPAGVVESRQCV